MFGDCSMEIRLAPINQDGDCRVISLEELLIEAGDGGFYYLNRDTKEKDLVKIVKAFQNKKRSAILHRITYGLDEKDFVYELHII